jgi:hypothetical protein
MLVAVPTIIGHDPQATVRGANGYTVIQGPLSPLGIGLDGRKEPRKAACFSFLVDEHSPSLGPSKCEFWNPGSSERTELQTRHSPIGKDTPESFFDSVAIHTDWSSDI